MKIPRALAGESRKAILDKLDNMHKAAGENLDLAGMQVLQFSKPGPPPPQLQSWIVKNVGDVSFDRYGCF